MTTAAERDDAIRKLGSITGVSPRGEGETLAAWTRRVAATRPDVFAKEFNGKSTDEVVAIVEEAEYTGLGKQVAAPKPEPKTIVLKAIYKPTGEALEYSPLA